MTGNLYCLILRLYNQSLAGNLSYAIKIPDYIDMLIQKNRIDTIMINEPFIDL
jgi:hypothetical protein